MKLSDFHVHPDYSIDAAGSINDYCLRALELNIKSICFTTHYDYNPVLHPGPDYWCFRGIKTRLSDRLVEEYLTDIEKARAEFKPRGLMVLGGLEFDYTPDAEKEIERLRSLFQFDFVLGSIHCVSGFIISENKGAEEFFGSRTMDRFADEYFDLLALSAECRAFDALGHLDYYTRFARKYYGDVIYDIDPDRFDPVFDTLKRNDIGIEINSSPIRRGENGFHPSLKILERAVNSGVKISSVGSDCHSPDQLGIGIKEAFQYLNSKNVIPRFPE